MGSYLALLAAGFSLEVCFLLLQTQRNRSTTRTRVPTSIEGFWFCWTPSSLSVKSALPAMSVGISQDGLLMWTQWPVYPSKCSPHCHLDQQHHGRPHRTAVDLQLHEPAFAVYPFQVVHPNVPCISSTFWSQRRDVNGLNIPNSSLEFRMFPIDVPPLQALPSEATKSHLSQDYGWKGTHRILGVVNEGLIHTTGCHACVFHNSGSNFERQLSEESHERFLSEASNINPTIVQHLSPAGSPFHPKNAAVFFGKVQETPEIAGVELVKRGITGKRGPPPPRTQGLLGKMCKNLRWIIRESLLEYVSTRVRFELVPKTDLVSNL